MKAERVRGRFRALVHAALRNGGYTKFDSHDAKLVDDAYQALPPEAKSYLSLDDFTSAFIEWILVYRPSELEGKELAIGRPVELDEGVERAVAEAFCDFMTSLPRQTRLLARVHSIEVPFEKLQLLGNGFGLIRLDERNVSTYMMVDCPGVPLPIAGRTTVQLALDKLKAWIAVESIRGAFRRNFGSAIDPVAIKFPVLLLADTSNKATTAMPMSGLGEIENFLRNTIVATLPVGLISASNPSYSIAHINALFEKSFEKSAKPILSGCQWLVDGDIAIDRSTKLLNYCLGLEAILGEASGRKQPGGSGGNSAEFEAPRSMMVADRCAFLLGDTAEAREDIRREVQELYGLRSKLVHGRVRRLTPAEEQHSNRARKYLAELILVLHGKLLKYIQEHPANSS